MKGLLQETHCPFLWPTTGDSLPVFLARYRRLIACFSGPPQETIACFSGPLSLISDFRAEGGFKQNFHLVYDVQGGDIFHIWKILFDDRVPLTLGVWSYRNWSSFQYKLSHLVCHAQLSPNMFQFLKYKEMYVICYFSEQLSVNSAWWNIPVRLGAVQV